MLEYKGYTGVIDEVDSKTGWFAGSIVGIQDVVTFEGRTTAELQKAFRDSVDDYLDFCSELKQSPEKPFSGKFVVRLSPELHRLVSEAARNEEVSLNTWMIAAAEERLNQAARAFPAMSFGEMDQLAACVAAILAEKTRRPDRSSPPDKKRRTKAVSNGK